MQSMSKVIAAIAFLALIPLGANAQNLRLGTAGSSLLQGEVAFNYQSGTTTTGGTRSDLPDVTRLYLGPSYGYFVINGLMLGAVLEYGRTSTETVTGTGGATTRNEVVTHGLLIGFRPAYYVPLMQSRALNFYVRGLLGFKLDKTSQTGVADTEATGFAGGAGLGVAFGFGAYWGGVLQLGLDYRYEGTSSTAAGSNVVTDRSEHIVTVGSSLGVYF